MWMAGTSPAMTVDRAVTTGAIAGLVVAMLA
jgi:hypothetical protein